MSIEGENVINQLQKQQRSAHTTKSDEDIMKTRKIVMTPNMPFESFDLIDCATYKAERIYFRFKLLFGTISKQTFLFVAL